MSTVDFYDALAPVYHLIYPDWEESVARQGRELDALLREAGETKYILSLARSG